ncbi:hypothetical protein ACVIVD_005577 [Bradyrhizobium liaoningense]
MTETTNVLAFRQPSAVDDPLTDIVRAGARDLLARAIEIPAGHFKFLRVWSVKFLHPRGRTRDC